MQPITITKSLSIASSTGLGAISSATPPVVTLNTSSLGTQRRISLSATADFSATYVVTGTREGGGSVSETVIGASVAGAAATTQDFLTVTSVSISSVTGIPVQIGTNTQGGTPWQAVDVTRNPIIVSGQIVLSSTANGVAASAEYTLGDYAGLNAVPTSIISTALSTATSKSNIGGINLVGTTFVPISAWRITMTSTATGAGSMAASVIQSG